MTNKTPRPLRVLIAEDDAGDAELMLRELRRAGFEPEAKRVETEAEFTVSLVPEVDIILSDYTMPQFSGLRALELLKERQLKTPFILVSATIGEEIAVAAMREGAADYLLKDRLARLGQAVEHALQEKQVRDERKRSEEAMQQSEHKYRHLFESLSEAAFLIDAKSRHILDVNLCAERLLGRTRSEILGVNEAKLFSPNEGANYCGKFASAGTDGKGELDEAEIQSKDGTTIPVRVSLAPIELCGRDLLLVLMADITERKRADEALRQTEKKYRDVFENAVEGIFQTTPGGGYISVNPALARMYGYGSPEELMATVSDIGHIVYVNPARRTEFKHLIEVQGFVEGFEYEVYRKDGTRIWLSENARAVRDENGTVVYYEGTTEDITKRKRAEEALRTSEAHLQTVVENLYEGVVVSDLKGELLHWNRAALKIHGYAHLEEGLRSLTEFVDTFELSAMDRMPVPVEEWPLSRVLRGETLRDLELRVRNIKADWERIFNYGGTLVHDANSQPLMAIVTMTDITERKRAEEHLLEQADIINRAQDAIIIWSFEDEVIAFWNMGAEKLYGWSAKEAVGKPIGELISANAKEREAPLKPLFSTGEFRGEIKQVTKDAREIIVDCRATVIRNPDGTPRSVLLINTDMTEQKKLETQLLRAQRLESIGTLASGVAHDLNNILTPILMCAQTLRGDLTKADRESAISLIEDSAQRGAGVVKQVLTFARGVEGERVLIKPNHLIEGMINIARNTFPKLIELTARYPENLRAIQGDPTQLHQVLLNLAVNARDAMPSGGSLTLAAENFTADEHYAAMTPDAKVGPYVVLRVSDSGAGMPRAMIDKIFDPFFTTKDVGQGTGLGLSTALGIVKGHGGFISVYSELGKGTTFKVFLPAATTHEDLQHSKTSVVPIRGNGELILVVDDEPNILGITKMILKKHNYDVLSANDGPEALALFAQQMESIGGVLTDIAMPYIDGVALVRALKKMKSDIPIIASTGQGNQPGMAELQSLGVKNFLTKPYNTEKLLATIHDTLQGCESVA